MNTEKKVISGQNIIVDTSVFQILVNCSIEMRDSNDIDVSAFLLNAGKFSLANIIKFF